jgi:phenylacrylic acid decarboxylase
VRSLHPLVHAVHSDHDLAAPISSGSFRCEATLIVPCSARTLGAIASGSGDTLISRAADVAIKERRRLVLALREAPLSSIHLRNALQVSDAGGIVYPLVPTFYANPVDVHQLTEQMAARLVDLCGFETDALPKWSESIGLTQQSHKKKAAKQSPDYGVSSGSGTPPE